MNARLDAIPLAAARLEREKVELAIERSKLEARKAAVVRVADAVGDGLALRRASRPWPHRSLRPLWAVIRDARRVHRLPGTPCHGRRA